MLHTITTCPTRWGNQYSQIERNNTLKHVLDPVIKAYQHVNVGKLDAIVEEAEGEQGSKAGQLVAASEIGLTSSDWDLSVQVEAFAEELYRIKETIEKRTFVTGAQAMIMLKVMHDKCEDDTDARITVKDLPQTAEFKHRVRSRSVETALAPIVTARQILADELHARLFLNRPSNARLVQAFMSKQADANDWMPMEWQPIARGEYQRMLRKIHTRLANDQGKSVAGSANAPGSNKRKANAISPPRLFSKRKSSLSDSAPSASIDATVCNRDGGDDEVTLEIKQWAALGDDTINEFTEDNGLVNECALMWEMRNRFPLHFILFKQLGGHLPHEANTESTFSMAGNLTDTSITPSHLARLVYIRKNMEVYKVQPEEIYKIYLNNYSKSGQLGAWETDTLGFDSGGPSSSSAGQTPSGGADGSKDELLLDDEEEDLENKDYLADLLVSDSN